VIARPGVYKVGVQTIRDIERCPSEDTVVLFLSGQLADREVVRLERHASTCPPCMELLTTAARLPPDGDPPDAARAPRLSVPDLVSSLLDLGSPERAGGSGAAAPRRLGSYRILARLGRGGIGVVYRARDERSGREVAIKTVRLPAKGALLSLRREIHTLSRIRHPGVVEILEQGGAGEDPPWYAMELVEGETLAEYLARSVNPTDEVLAIVSRLCATLGLLHASGVVHRDLSPRNIMVRGDGTPVLVDFGFALASGASPVAREVLEWEAMPAGTLLYMAPEQIVGEVSDARADLYSLGCILYEALTGRPPFSGNSAAEIISGHLSGDPAPPRQLVSALPAALEGLVLRLLAKRPRDRLAYADELEQALRDRPVGGSSAGPSSRGYLYRASLVGRADAMAVLDEQIRRCVEGQGGLSLVVGESGAGKTRFALEVASRARRSGFKVVLGTCTGGSLEPLKPLLKAVAERCQRLGKEETKRLLGPRGRLLAEHEPVLEGVPGFRELPVPPPLPGEAARVRLLDTLVHTLGGLAALGPVLLILDDLQWADELSLALLGQLSTGFFEKNPVVVLGTYREEEMEPEKGERLQRAPVGLVRLSKLDDGAVGAMIAEMLGTDAPPDGIAELVAAQAGGNPFFVVEYLRTALAEGRLVRRRGCWWLTPAPEADGQPLPMPEAVRELVLRRLGRLSPAAQELADLAAVLGRQFEGERLLAAARAAAPATPSQDGLRSDAEMSALVELVSGQVLEPAEPGQYRFVHDKLREIAYERIDPERRQALHRAAATTFEEAQPGGSDLGLTYAALAAHFGLGGQHRKSLHYLERAADRALRTGTAHEARGLATRALDVAKSHAFELPRATRVRLFRLRAEAAFALADLEACRRDASAALAELVGTLPSGSLGWAALLARQVFRQLLLRVLPPRPGGAGELRAARAEGAAAAGLFASVCYFTGEWSPMTTALMLGANLAERAGAPAESIESFARMGYIAGLARLDYVARFYFAQSARLARARGDARALAVSMYLRAFDDLGQGRWARAEAGGDEAVRLLEEVGDLQDADVARTIVGHAVFFQGRVEEAGDRYRLLAESARRRANKQHAGWGLALEARSLLELGRSADALVLLQEARPLLAALADALSIAMCEGLLASACLAEGRLPEAREVAAALAPKLAGAVLPLAPCLHAYVGACEVALAWPDGPDARAGARGAVRNLRRFARMFPIARPAALRVEAAVAIREGKPGRAARLARRSLQQARALGMVPEQARARRMLDELIF
jgi:hypothetical protein